MSKYWKTIVAVIGVAAVAVQTALTDGKVDRAELVTIGIAVLTAIGVYAKANKPAP